MRRLLAALAMIVAGFVAIPASPAAAHHDPNPEPAPNSHGWSVYCNINVQKWVSGTSPIGWARCTHGGTDILNISLVITANGSQQTLSSGWTLTKEGAGLTSATWSSGSTEPFTTLTVDSCEVNLDGAATGEYCDVQNVAGYPEWPSDYFQDDPNPPPPANTGVPAVACGRTLRDMGGGQWFADLDSLESYDPIINTIGSDWSNTWKILNGDDRTVVAHLGSDDFPTNGSGSKRTWALPADQALWPKNGYIAVRSATLSLANEAEYSFTNPGVTPTNGVWVAKNAGGWHYAARAARVAIAGVLRTVSGAPISETEVNDVLEDLTGYSFYQWSTGGSDFPDGDPASDTWVYGDGDMRDVQSVEAKCWAKLDPRTPNEAGSSDTTTDGGAADGDQADNVPAQNGSDCNVLGGVSKWVERVWLIGGLASDLANLVGSIGCVLKWLFLPDSLPWSDLWDEAKVKFPFSVGDEIGGALTRIHDSMSANKDAGDACGVIDLRSVMRSGAPEVVGTKVDNVIYRLPTPEESGCPSFRNSGVREGWENTLGDLLGFREVVRGAAALFMYIAFMLAVIRAFVDDDSKALEPS